MIKRIFGVVALALIVCNLATAANGSRSSSFAGGSRTEWDVQPSFALDTICFLNVLTGDPFYLDYYREEYIKFKPQITPKAADALADLKRKVKDEKGGIISAFLALNFSVTDDKTLDDMLRTVKDSSQMKSRLQKTVYYNDDDWKLYESV